MAHFNFVISQNAKWGHAGFYIDCYRMTVPENILLQKSTGCRPILLLINTAVQQCLLCNVSPACCACRYIGLEAAVIYDRSM